MSAAEIESFFADEAPSENDVEENEPEANETQAATARKNAKQRTLKRKAARDEEKMELDIIRRYC
jgi:hypothetical protein